MHAAAISNTAVTTMPEISAGLTVRSPKKLIWLDSCSTASRIVSWMVSAFPPSGMVNRLPIKKTTAIPSHTVRKTFLFS